MKYFRRNRTLSWEISYVFYDFDVKTSVKVEKQSISRTRFTMQKSSTFVEIEHLREKSHCKKICDWMIKWLQTNSMFTRRWWIIVVTLWIMIELSRENENVTNMFENLDWNLISSAKIHMRTNVNLIHIFTFDIWSSCTYLLFRLNIHVSVIVTSSQTRSLTERKWKFSKCYILSIKTLNSNKLTCLTISTWYDTRTSFAILMWK